MHGEIRGDAGAALREAREAAGLSLEAVADATKIRLEYLSALEDGDCRHLPAKPYAIAYARTYAQFVKLDPVEVAEAMKAEYLFAEARQLSLVKRSGRSWRMPRGLVGAAAVLALSAAAMTWYGYNAPARSEGAVAPAPAALERWSYEAAPPDESVWSTLAARARVQETVWEAGAPLPEDTLRPNTPFLYED